MNRYCPSAAAPVADVATSFGYVWAGLMFASAALNIALALWLDPKSWGARRHVGLGRGEQRSACFLYQYGWMTTVGRSSRHSRRTAST